jgi:hypothetical protein
LPRCEPIAQQIHSEQNAALQIARPIEHDRRLRVQLSEEARRQRSKHGLLRIEPRVERGRRDRRRCDDLAKRDIGVAVLGEDVFGGFEDPIRAWLLRSSNDHAAEISNAVMKKQTFVFYIHELLRRAGENGPGHAS